MNRSKTIYPLILASMLLLAGCAAGKAVTSAKIGAPDSATKVLIATQGSDFKNAVVSELVDELEREHVAIDIVDLKYLPEISAGAYDAIVILSDYKFFNFNPTVTTFLKHASAEEKQKVLLLTTAGSPHRMKEMTEVDAVSAASNINDSDSITQTVIHKINGILALE